MLKRFLTSLWICIYSGIIANIEPVLLEATQNPKKTIDMKILKLWIFIVDEQSTYIPNS